MIRKTTLKEYKKVQHARKMYGGVPPTMKNLFFKAPDGKWYKCDRTDMLGVKEIDRFKKNMADQMKAQTNLL